MKNKLQEHFQKNKQELPKYNTMRIGGDDHNPIWKSKVLLPDGTIYEGGEYTKKKESEESAAKLAYENLIVNKLHIRSKYPTHIFYDLENTSNFEILDNHTFENINIYGFVGKLHPFATKSTGSNYIEAHKFIIDSSHKDACDVSIIFYISNLLSHEFRNVNIIVITRDHFAAPLIELLNSEIFKLPGKILEAKHVTTTEECLILLKELSYV
jgi:hypothetical protein